MEGGDGKEKFSFLLSEWILQLSSGECAVIPQALLLTDGVLPHDSELPVPITTANSSCNACLV